MCIRDSPNPEPLTRLFQRGKRPVTVSELMESFSKSSRSLVFDANVCHAGTIRLDTKAGANLTADVVLDALREREERRNKRTAPYKPSPFMLRAQKRRKNRDEQYVDAALAPQREQMRTQLNNTRTVRRDMRCHNANVARRGEGSKGDPIV